MPESPTLTARLRPDGRYNLVVTWLTVAVIDQATLDGLGKYKAQLLGAGSSLDVFGLLSIAAAASGGQVEYTAHARRVFGEQ